MNFYDELKKIMIALAQVEGDSEIISINVRAGKHTYHINAQCEVEEVDEKWKEKRYEYIRIITVTEWAQR